MIMKVLGALFLIAAGISVVGESNPSIESIPSSFRRPVAARGIEQAACQTLRKRERRMNEPAESQWECGFHETTLPAIAA
jgi:hypothetical protein